MVSGRLVGRCSDHSGNSCRGVHAKMREADEQKAVADFLDYLGVLWCHVPNEGKRSYTTANNLRAQGLKKGVPDIIIFEPRKGYHGLAIEMKVGDNKPTAEQKHWLRSLTERGYMAGVCYSAESAIRVIRGYIK